MKTIGVVDYKGGGTHRSVVLDPHTMQTHIVSEGKDEKTLKDELARLYPGIEIVFNAYLFSKACKEAGINDWRPEGYNDHIKPEEQLFHQWEWVHIKGKSENYLITSASLVGGSWVYLVLQDGEEWRHEDSKMQSALEKAEQLPPKREVTLSVAGETGDILEYRGHRYQVMSSTYISQQEAADLEEGWDVFDAGGWHTQCILVGGE